MAACSDACRLIPPPSTRYSASLNDSNWHVKGGTTRKTRQLTMLSRPSAAPTKKTTKRRPSVHIQLNCTCTDCPNFLIDQPALLEINQKIATMGGGIIILAKKGTLFVHTYSLCSASVCFWVFAIPARTKKRGKMGAPGKKMEATNGPDPLPWRDCQVNLGKELQQ